MTKLLYFVSMGILAFWILRCESIAVNGDETQLMTLSDSGTFSSETIAQVPAAQPADATAKPTIPSAEVPEKSNTVANLIQSTDPEEREQVLKQQLGNQSGDAVAQPTQTISVPRGRDPFSAIPQIPVPELIPEASSVAQLPEIQGQQLPSLPTLPETTAPPTWQQNARRIVPSDDSLIAQERRRRPSPSSPLEPDMDSAFNSTFVEHGC